MSAGAPALLWSPVCMCQLFQLSEEFLDFGDPRCHLPLKKSTVNFIIQHMQSVSLLLYLGKCHQLQVRSRKRLVKIHPKVKKHSNRPVLRALILSLGFAGEIKEQLGWFISILWPCYWKRSERSDCGEHRGQAVLRALFAAKCLVSAILQAQPY